jgi:hypothetical protein
LCEEFHRAQDTRLLEVAEPEAAVEMRDAHELADALDPADAVSAVAAGIAMSREY